MIDVYFSKAIKIDVITQDKSVTIKDDTLYYNDNVVMRVLNNRNGCFDCCVIQLSDATIEFLFKLFKEYDVLWGFDGYQTDGAFKAFQESGIFEREGIIYNNKTPFEILVNYYYTEDMLQFIDVMDVHTLVKLKYIRDEANKEVKEITTLLENKI